MSDLRIPALDVGEHDAFSRCLAQLVDKRDRNLLRASLYDGRHAVRQVGTVIPPEYYRTAIVLGWPAKAVDLLSRRMTVDGFTLPDADIDALGLPELDEANALRSEISQGITSALLHSVAFAVATAGEPDEPTALVHIRDALSATGLFNRRTRRLSAALTVNEWDANADGVWPLSFTLYTPNRTTTGRRDPDTRAWSIDRLEHGFGVPVEPLVYKPRLGRPFGSSRISRPVISAYRAAVRTAIRMEGNADIYSFPQLVLLGAGADVFRNPDGTIKPAWQVALGRVFALEDDEEATNPRASVQRFDAASPEPHLKMLRQQAELFAGETSIPLTSLGVTGDGNPTSAESYIASREDLISESEGASDDMSPGLARTVARALAIQNGLSEVPAEWGRLAPKWRSPIYTSRAAAADAGAKILGAVPWLAETSVGLELLGVTDAQAERALAERRRAAGRQLGAQLAAAAAPPNTPSGPVDATTAAPASVGTPGAPQAASGPVSVSGGVATK